MKILSFLAIVIITLMSFTSSNNLAYSPQKESIKDILINTSKWSVNGPAFCSTERTDYNLNIIKKNKKGWPFFGHSITFKKDDTFSSHYAAQCGMDCFHSSTGTYKVIGNNKIKIFVTSATKSGFCDNKSNDSQSQTLLENETLGTFLIEQLENKGLTLKLLK